MRKPTDTKDKLLETAISLIWQSNYSNVGVNDICTHAGVTKGSFYHYFETKADLFCEASDHYWEDLKKDLDEIYSPSYTPLEQLENLIQLVLAKQELNKQDGNPVSGCPFFTSGAQAGTEEAKVRLAAREMSDKAVKYSAALVRNLNAEGLLRGNPNPQQLGRLLHQFIQGLLIFGRVYFDINVVKTDLREGVYRLLDLKCEYRRQASDNTQPIAITENSAVSS
jgi:TetR/AcrR family transcriptional regulator, transcriptional repressor for nem operon